MTDEKVLQWLEDADLEDWQLREITEVKDRREREFRKLANSIESKMLEVLMPWQN